jgi:hypothetical protein
LFLSFCEKRRLIFHVKVFLHFRAYLDLIIWAYILNKHLWDYLGELIGNNLWHD